MSIKLSVTEEFELESLYRLVRECLKDTPEDVEEAIRSALETAHNLGILYGWELMERSGYRR